MIVGYILFACAAFFDAVCDTVENTPNFNKSIFKNYDKKFWCKDVSWQYVEKIFSYPLDAWHFCKSLMIVLLIGAIISFHVEKDLLLHFVLLGCTWNVSFWLFYIKVFRK